MTKIETIQISKPAHRALASIGITTLEQLAQYHEKDLLALHGFGPKALDVLKQTMQAHGLSFQSSKN